MGGVLGTRLEMPVGAAADLSSANLLTVFVALCLASDFASWRRRLMAIACGIPLLIGVECAGGIAGMSLGPALGDAGVHGAGWNDVALQLLELARWLGVPLVWAGLLGHLGLARPRTPRNDRPSRAPAGRDLRRAGISH